MASRWSFPVLLVVHHRRRRRRRVNRFLLPRYRSTSSRSNVPASELPAIPPVLDDVPSYSLDRFFTQFGNLRHDYARWTLM